MLTRRFCWIALMASLLIHSCGGGGSEIAQGLDPAPDSPREFSLTVLDESFLADSVAEFSLELRQADNQLVVRVLVDNAEDLRAAYIQLEYDERFYTPLGVDAEGLLGLPAELLSLSVTDRPGIVGYGEVLIRPDEAAGYNGAGLLAEIRFRNSPFEQTRVAAMAPDDNSSATTLEFITGLDTFWYYYSTGDYDQNGQTNIADLTPLGRHFGESGPFDEATVQGVIDYDNNDLINISDVTGIGIGFGNTVDMYSMYESTNHEADYPASNGEAPKLDALLMLPFASAIGDKSLDRLHFEQALEGTTPGAGYWVRPADGNSDGTPSNKVTFDDIPDFNLTFYQIDYTLDEDVQVDSELGHVAIEYTGKAEPEYFNLNVNDEWVIENVPILPVEGVGELQTVYLDFPLGVEPGTEVLEIEHGASLTSDVKTEKPKKNHSLGALTALVMIYNGQDEDTALASAEVKKEIGDEIDGDNWGVHGSKFPNQEAKKNECVPAAVANSLKFLKDKNAATLGGVADGDIDSTAIGGAVGYTEAGGTKGANGKATWPGKKNKYMKDKKIPIRTTAVPAEQSFSGEATAADCDKALQAVKDGKDVELQGRNHCAAIVGMAKLKNGKYVIYVAHDTEQGKEGGQKVQKIIYDPSVASPKAEGGAGFNGRNIFGFVIESVDTKQDGKISYLQDNYFIDTFTQLDSEHGEIEFTYEQTADPLLFLNVSIDGTQQILDLPLRSGEAGTTSTVYIPIAYNGGEGNDMLDITSGHTLDTLPTGLQPEENLLHEVGDDDFKVDSGEDGAPLQYSGVTVDPVWFLGHNYTDAAFHPTSTIVNQEAGSKECAPAAISNSLKLLKKLNPTINQDLDVDIGTVKPATGWTAAIGAPVNGLNGAGSWWNRKKKWMNDKKEYPVQTDIVSDKSKFDDIIKAIKAGKDVELRVPGHVVMVTGIIKLANGQYILEIVHDADQTDNAKGTQTELVKYDPTTNTFSGRGWINGKKFTDGGNLGCLFVVESFSNLNVKRTNISVDETVIDLSNYGEIKLDYTASEDMYYFNFVSEGVWKIKNMPVPSLGDNGDDETATVRFQFDDLLPGEALEEIEYSWEFGLLPLEAAPADIETSIIDPEEFIVGTGEAATPLLSPASTVSVFDWLPFGIADIACHPAANIVNQEAGDNECAPTAISNSLKLLQNANPTGMAGLDIDIDDMKPATGWTAGGAPAGNPEDAGAWWNLKKQYMIDNGYPVTTEIKTKDDFGEIVDDIRAGKDVEMRVPGHVVMVTCVIVLANGDMIFWVAHDTDQDDDTKGTTVEPIYYDASEGTFHGSFWVEGKTAATPGNAGCLFVVEDYLDLLLPIPLCVDPFSLLPVGPPGIIPDGHSGMAQLLHRDTLQPMGQIPFVFFDPDGNHISWQPGTSGGPLIVFDNLTGPQQLGVQFFGEGAQLDFPGYVPGMVGVELQLYTAFGGIGDQPAGVGQITLADFTPLGQFPLGPSLVPPASPPNSFGVTLEFPTPPNDFFFGTFQQPNSTLELSGVYMDWLAFPIPE